MNRLSAERSPYLRQHADNPVDWYAWNSEAFGAARQGDKPIFLSIGYSTCHWCHVMAHESFEDPVIAELLNRDYISIKVDREERPDVDRVYMTFVQATTGAGGWPMSVWLTPDLKPFFGGTYFPPHAKWGRPGFSDILAQIARAWHDERGQILQSADALVAQLREATGAGARPDRASVAGREAIDAGVAAFAQAYDRRHGGFGGAPKFPRPSELFFLMDAAVATASPPAREMALESLRAMAMGGMHDHVGGGFHRYSVDAEWRVPHFEKMLYDQAQLVLAYLEAGQISGDPLFAAVAEDTLDYVLRELTGPDGAFLSAEDADSQPHNPSPEPQVPSPVRHASREGAFYVWTAAEIDALFGPDAPIVRRRFGVEDRGNAPSDPQAEFVNQNILHVAQSIDDIAARSGRSVESIMSVLTGARERLFAARATRPRPHLDDKVIAAWNGLMIAAFARAARVLVDSPSRGRWRDAAERAARAMETVLWDVTRQRLSRRSREGEAGIDGFCEDYACVTWGVLELFQATGDRRWLDWARALTSVQTTLFRDDQDGGWFSTTGDDPSVLLRLKEDYDGAEPAAASVTVRNLLVLGHLAGDATLVEQGQRTLERYGPGLGSVARVMPFMLANVVLWHSPATQVVIVGAAGLDATRALERVVAREHLPAAVHIPVASVESAASLGASMPWLAAMRARDGRPTAYVCRDFACRAPVMDPDELAGQLAEAALLGPRLYL